VDRADKDNVNLINPKHDGALTVGRAAHVHMVVRGIDQDGDDVPIDRGYLAHGMRWRAQEILTPELGEARQIVDRAGGGAIGLSGSPAGLEEMQLARKESASA